jgi:RimJ/RimL family protein N-acetyltransferase
MLYHMYRRAMTPLDGVPALPADLRLEFWRPSLGGPVHPRLLGFPFLAWSLFHFARVFAGRDYALLLLFRDGALVHRTCLLPAHFRFPFMSAPDLQAAGLWTAPEFRGRGLGLLALGEALRRLQDPGRTLWYMARLDNLPSIRLAEKAGFVPFGRVARRKRLGSHLLGSFQLEALYGQPGMDGRFRDTIPS